MIRLKAVVLPEPFGPTSAVIEPSGTANEQSSTAVTPPKRFVRPVDLEQRASRVRLLVDDRLAVRALPLAQRVERVCAATAGSRAAGASSTTMKTAA